MIIELYTTPEGEEIFHEDIVKVKEFVRELGFTVDFISASSTKSWDGRDHYEEKLINYGGKHTAQGYVKRRDALKDTDIQDDSFDQAAAFWYETADLYDDFGASDTEPRSVFAEIVIDLAEGRDPKVPTTIRGWQLYSGEVKDGKNSANAARALTAAAQHVVTIGKKQQTSAARYAKNEGWI